MMQLIQKTNRRVVTHRNFGGVCHICNSPVAFDGEMIVIEIEETADCWRVVSIDTYGCPYCGEPVIAVRIYKSL